MQQITIVKGTVMESVIRICSNKTQLLCSDSAVLAVRGNVLYYCSIHDARTVIRCVCVYETVVTVIFTSKPVIVKTLTASACSNGSECKIS